MPHPQTRYETLDLLGYPPDKPIVGVEVGTDQGAYAAELLKCYPNLFLITVDNWLPYQEIVTPDGEWDDRILARRRYRTSMGPYRGRFAHVEQDSVLAARNLTLGLTPVSVPCPPYDFVYIDAAHDYESVRTDLDTWWPLVKVGGVFTGHDFDIPSVSRAVIEFAKYHRCDLQIINEHGGPDMGILPDGSKKPGTGCDRLGTWSRPNWYWFKEREGQ